VSGRAGLGFSPFTSVTLEQPTPTMYAVYGVRKLGLSLSL